MLLLATLEQNRVMPAVPGWLVIPDSFPDSAYPKGTNGTRKLKRQTPMDGMPGAVNQPNFGVSDPKTVHGPLPKHSPNSTKQASGTCPTTPPSLQGRARNQCMTSKSTSLSVRSESSVALTRHTAHRRHISQHASARLRPKFTSTSVQPYLDHLQCAVESIRKTVELVVNNYVSYSDAPGLIYMALVTDCANATERFHSWAATAKGYEALISYQRIVIVDGKKPVGMTDDQLAIALGKFSAHGLESAGEAVVRKATLGYRLPQLEVSSELEASFGSSIQATSTAVPSQIKRSHKGQFEECMEDAEEDAKSSEQKGPRFLRFMARNQLATYTRNPPSHPADNSVAVFTDAVSRRKHCKRMVKHSYSLFLTILGSVVALVLACVCYALYRHKRSVSEHNGQNRGIRRRLRRSVNFNDDPTHHHQPAWFIIWLYYYLFPPTRANRQRQARPVGILKRRVAPNLPIAAPAAALKEIAARDPAQALHRMNDSDTESSGDELGECAVTSSPSPAGSSVSSLASSGSVIRYPQLHPRIEDSRFPRTRIPTPPTRPAPVVPAKEKTPAISLAPIADLPATPERKNLREPVVFSPATCAAADALVSLALAAPHPRDQRPKSRLPLPVISSSREHLTSSQLARSQSQEDVAASTSGAPSVPAPAAIGISALATKPASTMHRRASNSSSISSNRSSIGSASSKPLEIKMKKRRSPLGEVSSTAAVRNAAVPSSRRASSSSAISITPASSPRPAAMTFFPRIASPLVVSPRVGSSPSVTSPRTVSGNPGTGATSPFNRRVSSAFTIASDSGSPRLKEGASSKTATPKSKGVTPKSTKSPVEAKVKRVQSISSSSSNTPSTSSGAGHTPEELASLGVHVVDFAEPHFKVASSPSKKAGNDQSASRKTSTSSLDDWS
ncbi:hypothetical protein L228DRAFT_12374 [Xylona heveae TC161]|uniref:Uncharacterized protein n=1 Tax=Xylona heveae (strain CBS 132557 / TC161) TaxID=1328760 RepID=A0A165JMR1_XYLHT|nr:hypothetical protein L228DRAFT_12374 [Xylona heveae TC161]KZF26429.1 hypothetical protein L228DRAFT_12374 [Xylona heveae TC161]